ncbi:MAG TPA: M23 family metallopeptidase [Anaerolineae bacterium]|nr:M23 family metallopeptidase [Anaerolineae bacterium]HID84132.1 M23 family metallopeptidase [Anaerolineales bacterium]HIQ09378.1 M23 family metallopeptidase [Anaerolineaceae bacterium]
MKKVSFGGAIGLLLLAGGLLYLRYGSSARRSARLVAFLRAPQEHSDWVVPARIRCGDAPFLMPTAGYIGYLWGDRFQLLHTHQGVDIFGGTAPGETPVYAAYDGLLTRLPAWKSAVIIRHEDPLHPDRIIWTYYAHMADPQGRSLIAPDFPPGTEDRPVQAGTLLGYQGNYSGNPRRPVGVHLHFSIVLGDGQGRFRNELDIANTLDPSPYLGLSLNAREVPPDRVPLCPPEDIHPFEE